jgi:hypothetical protein
MENPLAKTIRARVLRIRKNRPVISRYERNPKVPVRCSILPDNGPKSRLGRWNSSMINLLLVPGQKSKSLLKGDELQKALAGKPVLNAGIADFLTSHPENFPKSWKKRKTLYVVFWGTIYNDTAGYPYVRALYWDYISKELREHRCFLFHYFGQNFPAAILKSVSGRRNR